MKFGALKAAVIVMGVLIVAGMGFLVYGLSVGLHKATVTDGEVLTEAPPPITTALAQFGDINIDLPEGAQVEDYKIQGDRLIVSISIFGGGIQLIIVDLASGSRLGTINLN